MKDYYRILGILDDAEDIIIRAAYKALAQRYHPDKWKGDKTEATKRMQDINEAYEVLSDLDKRKHYDENYFKSKPRDDAESESSSSDFEDYEDESDEAWKMASEFYPKIIQEYNELKKISHILANTYKSALISTQSYKDSTRIRFKYENDYLERFYGSDKEIQGYAKKLLINNFFNAAIEVNKIIRFLGTSINIQQVIERIFEKFPDVKNNNTFAHDLYFISLYKRARKGNINEEEAIKIMLRLDARVSKIIKRNWFVDSHEYSFTIKKTGKTYVLSLTQLKEFISEVIKEI